MNLFSLGFWGSTVFSSEFCLLLFGTSCWSCSSPWPLNTGVPWDSVRHSSLLSGICSQDVDYHLYTQDIQMSLSSLDLPAETPSLYIHSVFHSRHSSAPSPQWLPFPSVQKSTGLISLCSTLQKALSTNELQVFGFCCFLPQTSAGLAPDLSA